MAKTYNLNSTSPVWVMSVCYTQYGKVRHYPTMVVARSSPEAFGLAYNRALEKGMEDISISPPKELGEMFGSLHAWETRHLNDTN